MDESESWVLKVGIVRECIERLQSLSVHPYFIAYLHLRQQAGTEGRLSGLRPQWKKRLGPMLEVAGAPAKHPYYRPFWEGHPEAGQYWLNANLAGSFAGSSVRTGQPPMQVVEYDTQRRRFTLRPRHWRLARKHLLGGSQMPVAPLAGFLFRDYAFESSGERPDGDDLVAIFRDVFSYDTPDDDREFEHVYALEPAADGNWFEPFAAIASEGE